MPYNSLISRTDMGGMIPIEYSREIIGRIAEDSVVLRMGRRLRDMPVKQRTMPVLSALPIAYFVNGDTGLKQTTEVNWSGVTLTAEEVAVIVPIPQAALDDNQFPIWDEVKPLIVEAAGLAIDQAVLFGTNAPASWPTDILADCVSKSNTVTLGAGADIYDDILSESGVVALVEADGFMVTGYVADISMKARLRGLRDADGNPIFMRNMQDGGIYQLDGEPLYFPLNGCMDASQAHLFCGAWQYLVYAFRQDISWMLSDQGVIQDAGGNIVYNLFQQDMVALRMVLRLGVQLPNPVTRLNASTQYPFAALIP